MAQTQQINTRGKPRGAAAQQPAAGSSQSNMAQRRFEFENAISDEQLFTWNQE